MAKWTVGHGIDDYLAQLGNLEFDAPAAVGEAIYQGAKVVADQIRANIQAMPVSENKGHSSGSGRRNPTQAEKDGLLRGLGIARKQNDGGFINVKIGMHGYNSDVTEKYPKGKPNAMIARSIENGTTFMNRIPFISRTVRSTKAVAEEAMRTEIEKHINNSMK